MKPGSLVLLLVAAGPLMSATPASSANTGDPGPRGGRVGWARIITTSQFWQRHARADPILSEFIRTQTSLNMDPQWYSADPSDVKQLCAYPLLFTNSLLDVRASAARKNLEEYVRRGGFLLIDACINPTVTANPDRFLADHRVAMNELVRGAQVRALPATHAIYRDYFVLAQTPPHSYMENVYDRRWARHGLYGVFDGDRMFALISLSGLQCGWDQNGPPGHAEKCMQMLVNIYVYALTRNAEPAPPSP